MASPSQTDRKPAVRPLSGWTRLWLLSAVAVWAFDGWVISKSVPFLWPQSNESLGRAGICQWEEENFINSHPIVVPQGESVFDTCMTRIGESERIAELRQKAIDYKRLFVAKFVALIAVTPFGIAGLFVAIKRAFRIVDARPSKIR